SLRKRRAPSDADGLERFRRADRPAAEARFAIVEHDPLARRDRPLRRGKAHMRPLPRARHGHGPVRLPVAELGRAGELPGRRRARDPADARRVEREGKQLLVLALLYDEQVARKILADDEPALPRAAALAADAQTAALPERV